MSATRRMFTAVKTLCYPPIVAPLKICASCSFTRTDAVVPFWLRNEPPKIQVRGASGDWRTTGGRSADG